MRGYLIVIIVLGSWFSAFGQQTDFVIADAEKTLLYRQYPNILTFSSNRKMDTLWVVCDSALIEYRDRNRVNFTVKTKGILEVTLMGKRRKKTYELGKQRFLVQSPASAIADLDDKIRLNLNKEGNKSELQDGMDITVLVYQPEINRVQLSGAGNPIVQIRNGELIIHKLDRYGVGGLKQRKKDFQLIEVDLEQNDCFYLFTDGFQDQFGGPKGDLFIFLSSLY